MARRRYTTTEQIFNNSEITNILTYAINSLYKMPPEPASFGLLQIWIRINIKGNVDQYSAISDELKEINANLKLIAADEATGLLIVQDIEDIFYKMIEHNQYGAYREVRIAVNVILELIEPED